MLISQKKNYPNACCNRKYDYICAPVKKDRRRFKRRKFFEIPDFSAGVAQLARAADL
jgi:hypothetical protein